MRSKTDFIRYLACVDKAQVKENIKISDKTKGYIYTPDGKLRTET